MTQPLGFMKYLTTMSDHNGNNIDVLYLDFRKAFDSVANKRILLKMLT